MTCVTVRRLDRIIPARAGFTRVFVSSRVAFRDHPRSRGVYPSACRALRPALGSSPLARGLRERQDEGLGVDGIIPARAGFTRRPRGTERRCSDHPRSRGVYVRALTRLFRGVGSSPLARGLPDRQFVQHVVEGIIPARAGFTTGGRTSWTSRTDHPRSRGVYSRFAFRFRVFVGSSPLARGLLRVGGGMGGRRGIIPARAGFTAAGCPRRGPSPDHPRSRGVYSPLARG